MNSAESEYETLRRDSQHAAAQGAYGLLPELIELAKASDDPDYKLKVVTLLKGWAGMDAAKTKEPEDTRPPTIINIITQVEPSEALASLSGPSVPEADILEINADIADVENPPDPDHDD